jgi:anti-sigma factor ChrR (cupin superfamily)
MDPSPGAVHPDGERLAQFVHGRLGSRELERVARHLLVCDACCRAALAVPDDRLTRLLRRPRPEPVGGPVTSEPARSASP